MSTATIAAPAAPGTDEDRLRADLIEWIKGRQLKGRGPLNRAGYSPEKTAGLIVASLWGPTLRQMIYADDSPYLWHACVNIKDSDDLTPAEEITELHIHGGLSLAEVYA